MITPFSFFTSAEGKVELIQPRSKALTLEQLHHDERDAVRHAPEIEHVDDVRVPHGAGDPGLALEAVDAAGIGLAGRQHLDRDRPRQAQVVCPIDRAQGAMADQRADPVGVVEHGPDQERGIVRWDLSAGGVLGR